MMRQVGAAFLYCSDWRGIGSPLVDAVITDPPYGINYTVRRRPRRTGSNGLKATPATFTEYRAPIVEDDRGFDPAPILAMADRVAIFGANHFANKLPVGRWIVWDKRRDSEPDDHSDAEIVWLSGDSREALRIHRQKWRGVVREGEENCSRSKKLHPNQKPVALLDRIISALGLSRGETVFDPYMGSGSTGVAAVRRGLIFVGCEIDQQHFETAYKRLQAEVRT